jgi:hypothetical protein
MGKKMSKLQENISQLPMLRKLIWRTMDDSTRDLLPDLSCHVFRHLSHLAFFSPTILAAAEFIGGLAKETSCSNLQVHLRAEVPRQNQLESLIQTIACQISAKTLEHLWIQFK